MKSRAPNPALSPVLALVLLAGGLGGCRIIPEGAAAPSPARMTQPRVPAPASPAYSPAPAYTPAPAYPPPVPGPAASGATAPASPARGRELPPVGSSAPAALPYRGPPLVYTRIGESVRVDGPRVTPLSLLEDSRCPQGVQCVTAGRLRLRVRVDLGSGSRKLDLVLGQPAAVADGSLTLLDARPAPVAGRKPAPLAYQFGFRFMGGI